MISMVQTIPCQRIAVDNLNSMADNAVLQVTIIRLKTQLSAANDLNELWDGELL